MYLIGEALRVCQQQRRAQDYAEGGLKVYNKNAIKYFK